MSAIVEVRDEQTGVLLFRGKGDGMSGCRHVRGCALPNASKRRWRNAVYICPDCGQGWTSRHSTQIPDELALIAWNTPQWDWWRWPLPPNTGWSGIKYGPASLPVGDEPQAATAQPDPKETQP